MTFMPVSKISVLGSSWSKGGGSRWMGQIGEVQQHLFRRRLRLTLGLGDPDFEMLARPLGQSFDARTLEDDVAGVGGGVGDSVVHQAAHARDPLERVLEHAIVAQMHAALGERGHALQHTQDQVRTQVGLVLCREQTQHRALEGVALGEGPQAVVGQR